MPQCYCSRQQRHRQDACVPSARPRRLSVYMLEGPFARVYGSIGYPKTATGNCFVNGLAPQWALDVLKSRAHDADSAANGAT
jgi:hypothetical protein